MDEQTMSGEEKLKQINEERKSLKKQIKSERTLRLEEAVKMRENRDIVVDAINKGLNEILELIYAYNKLGKVEKYKRNIFKEISDQLNKPGGENGRNNTENSE